MDVTAEFRIEFVQTLEDLKNACDELDALIATAEKIIKKLENEK